MQRLEILGVLGSTAAAADADTAAGGGGWGPPRSLPLPRRPLPRSWSSRALERSRASASSPRRPPASIHSEGLGRGCIGLVILN